MTANKSQGQSFENRLGGDLCRDCFSNFQIYFALFRMIPFRNKALLGSSGDEVGQNVVFQEVLSG